MNKTAAAIAISWMVGVALLSAGLALVYRPLGLITLGVAFLGAGGLRPLALALFYGLKECPPSMWGSGVTDSNGTPKSKE